jgi:hypothetical protein
MLAVAVGLVATLLGCTQTSQGRPAAVASASAPLPPPVDPAPPPPAIDSTLQPVEGAEPNAEPAQPAEPHTTPFSGGPTWNETVEAISRIQRDDPSIAVAAEFSTASNCVLRIQSRDASALIDMHYLHFGTLDSAERVLEPLGQIAYRMHIASDSGAFELRFETLAGGQRLANALRHLGELCGAPRAAF